MSMFKNKTATAKFYKEPAMVEEVYTGYLHKSPGQSALLKSVKSWKQRFFVFSKTVEDTYHLTYYTNNEKRNKTVGKIEISKISLLFIGPEKHQMWNWIQKHFSCTPASVLFLRVEDDTPKHARDYFLIGENSDDVNGWHNTLVKALKTQKSNKLRHTDDTLEDNRFRSMAAPVKCPEPKDERWSAPELMLSSLPPNHYAYPRKFSEPLVPAERKEQGNHVEMNTYNVQYFISFLIIFSSVSECHQIQHSCLFHKEDQILAFNDLLIDTLEEIDTYLRRLSKDEDPSLCTLNLTSPH
ncbi:pleckstrin homology domain-containing family S member 1-like [Ctenopharyngodon idella]|uniref:pleckstrin homology domain-containing family S member 1-like n=1 Tax=Ctenopharyngodon idella TaxID=7959 RepID=UPI00222E3308|nr:pleckstrin homology domain-containing family S member 1-like [Ctenopharyngodon idella]